MQDSDPVIEMLEDEGASLVLEYGSSVENPDTANDIDLFALYEEDPPEPGNLAVGEYEIIRLSTTEFDQYRRLLNPVYCTEPFLCGDVRHGNEDAFQDIRQQVRSAEPDSETVQHNLTKSVSEYQKAVTQCQNNQVEFGLRSLNFAASYRLFARWYATDHQPATLAEIRETLETSSSESELFQVHSQSKSGKPVQVETLEGLIQRWERECLI